MQIIPSPHFLTISRLFTSTQAHVLHDFVGSLGLFPPSLATLTWPHSLRMFHSSLQCVLYQRCELHLEPWLLYGLWFMYPVTVEISTDTLKSMFTLQYPVFPETCFPSLFSVSWSDTILLSTQAKNNVVPYLSSPSSRSSATWIPSLFLKPLLPCQGCL